MIKLWAVIALVILAALLVSIPVSVQPTRNGLEIGISEANAITYRRARVTHRRVYRRTARRVYRGTGVYYGARRCYC